MRNLHGVIVGSIEGWAWFTMYGANGRDIDRGTEHLFPVSRGTPPPVGTRPTYMRQYWTPWGNRHPQHLNQAMCHNVPSKSRQPRFHERDPAHVTNGCETCTRLAQNMGITPVYTQRLRAADPWNLMGIAARADTNLRMTDRPWFENPDPVSGI